jgi:hypothetical protein
LRSTAFLAIFIFLGVLPAQAKTLMLAQNPGLAVTLKPATVVKRFSMGLALEQSANFFETQGVKSSALALEIAPQYRFNEIYSLSALAYLIRDFNNSEDLLIMKSTALALSFAKFELDSEATLTTSLITVLPTNRLDYEQSRYRGGIGVKSALAIELGSIGFNFSLSLRKNFNEYTTSAESEQLIEYAMPLDLAMEYSWTKNLKSTIFSRYIIARTYSESDRSKFMTKAELAYAFNKSWNIYGGLSNEGDAFKYDGISNNVSFFNENTTELYFGVGVSI